MAMSPHFFNKREPETAPARPGSSTSNVNSYSASGTTGTQQPSTVNSASPATTAPATPITPQSGSKLTVGPNIKLKGVEITDCDTLVVEGLVEATMDSRVIEISERGAFKGSAEIDMAEIHGQFDGNLTVRQKLTIYATGKVSGKIRYGKVVIEEGGQLTGDIQFGAMPTPKSASQAQAA
ncbi:MAG: polymer-forming cytoskeletal protein [Rhodoferax sp.]|uniref:bactofilin family protein n=1 Tax=Rhodoferax sp. TaxID=50421 RepID=UPI0013FFAC6F|nr:polymer-forming cytoskeletal protein [Rhodoferax sp.]NDP38184.1 polymer-forming cytoskeletal protein [Rhodoferax sp.]